MKVHCWNELNDQQAEKACGGAGIGQVLSSDIHEVQETARNNGYQNLNQYFSATGVGYPGQQGFGPNNNNRSTDTVGEAIANFINNVLKP